MASSFELSFDGTAIDDRMYQAVSTIEVEENAELPDAIQISLGMSAVDGELDFVGDSRLQPFTNVTLVASLENGDSQCLFDGYILSHRIHVETGVTSSTLEVWGQDSSWLMNLEEKVREWVNVTDADVASSIFQDHGITPSSDNQNEDSPAHTEGGHTLMQRSTDIQFLRSLARRNGKLCRVFCTDSPGDRTGYFAFPDLSGSPVASIKPNDTVAPTVAKVDIEWDVTRPSQVVARQALFDNSDDEDGANGDASDSGLTLLDANGLSDFRGRDISVLLTAPVDAGGELVMRSQALLRDSGMFVQCTAEAEVTRVGKILRVGDLVSLEGCGSVHSGNYLVWSVRHTINRQAHRMRFALRRNAVGSTNGGGSVGALPSVVGI
jgi:phage protein D